MDRNHDSAAIARLVGELEQARASALRLLASRETERVSDDAELDPGLAELVQVLRRARRVMIQSPVASRAVVSWLVEEGRRYATTPEGRADERALLASPGVEHLREIWEAVSLSVFDRVDEDSAVPSAWLDLLTDAAASHDAMDLVIDSMRPPGVA